MELQFEDRDGKKKLRCLIRKKLIAATPEEEVRQIFIHELLSRYEIPESMLCVEERLSHYGLKIIKRADIIVDFESEGGRFPLVIVECKARSIPLTYKVREQIDDYNSHLGAKIIGMTNGLITQWFSLNENSNEFEQIESLPSYSEICLNKGIKFIQYDIFHSLNEKNEEFKKVTNILKPIVVNFSNLLLNKDKKIEINFGDYNIEDIGIRIENNGNAGGENDWNGEFRVLKLIDSKLKSKTISFRVFPFGSPIFPYLVVAYDNGKSSHNSLQLNFGDWIAISGNILEFWHDGTMTVGHSGRVPNDSVIGIVSENYPELIVREKIYLGRLDVSKELTFEDEDLIRFFQNLIKYTICRERLRVKINTENKLKKQNSKD